MKLQNLIIPTELAAEIVWMEDIVKDNPEMGKHPTLFLAKFGKVEGKKPLQTFLQEFIPKNSRCKNPR